MTETYLSQDYCKQLQTIPETFPSIGSCPTAAGQVTVPSIMAAVGTSPTVTPTCTDAGVPLASDQPCQWPKRSLPPSELPQLPCEATEENLPALKQFIMNHFAASAFNCCEHQPLPLMAQQYPLYARPVVANEGLRPLGHPHGSAAQWGQGPRGISELKYNYLPL